MKRYLIILITAAISQSCIFFLFDAVTFNDYYDPEITNSSDTSSTYHGTTGEIPSIGDTCWFEVKYKYVPTKFQPGESRRAFRYIIQIEGMEAGKPIIIKGWENQEEHRDSPCETWYERKDYETFMVYFRTPENYSDKDRKVMAKVSVSNNYGDKTILWEEWETVLNLIQKGTK